MNEQNARTEYNFKAMKSLLRHNIDSFWGGVWGEKSIEISFLVFFYQDQIQSIVYEYFNHFRVAWNWHRRFIGVGFIFLNILSGWVVFWEKL